MVNWMKLGDVCEIVRGVRLIRKELEKEGNIPVFQNSLTPLGFYSESNNPGHTTFIICAGAAGEIGYSNIPFWAADDCLCLTCPDSLHNKYAYYYLLVSQSSLKSKVRKASVPRLSRIEVERILIPIPSLSEQKRIVGILDTFTDSIENLKQQIDQRRKQYEHYRDQLLDLEGKEGVEMKTLGEVCIKTSNIRWKNTSDDEAFKYIDLSSVNRDTHTIDDFLEINKNNAPSRAQQIVYEGDVILGTTRPTLSRYCQIPQQYDNQICSTGFCIYRANKDIVLNRWLFHNIGNSNFWDYCELKQQGAGYPCLSNSDAFAYIIPVPSLQEQQRIVSILDTFEASIQNLEAQLKERQKQYEYYRNKLLSFEKEEH
ncbi:MAG: restriction endonuclease subunit S [Prevotella sp.]|nr:restriction endonuclease subunit S [Prevotella sp.]